MNNKVVNNFASAKFINPRSRNSRPYEKLSTATIRVLMEKEDLKQESERNQGYVQWLQRENRILKNDRNWHREKSSRMEKLVVKTMVEQDMNCPCEWSDNEEECKNGRFCTFIREALVDAKLERQLQIQKEINNELMTENAEVMKRGKQKEVEEGEIESE